MKIRRYAIATLLLAAVSCNKEQAPTRFDVFTSIIKRPIEGTYDCTIITRDIIAFVPQNERTSQQVITITKKNESELIFQQPSSPAKFYTYGTNGTIAMKSQYYYTFRPTEANASYGPIGFNKGDSLFFNFSDGSRDLRSYTTFEGRGKRRP